MSQEINIRLRADTSDAVRSIRDLEQQVSNVGNTRRRADADRGLLSEEDVRRFQRIANDAEKVYRSFFDNYLRIQRSFESRRREMERNVTNSQGAVGHAGYNLGGGAAGGGGGGHVTPPSPPGSQQSPMSPISGGSASSMANSPSMMNQMLMMSRRLLPMIGATMSASALYGFVRQGMNQIKIDEDYMSSLGQRVSGFGGDYEKGRLEAEALGLKGGNAYKALDTMRVADTFTSLAGARSKGDMWAATNQIQTLGRVTGLDPNELAGQAGNLTKMGAFNHQSLKGFQDAMVGAIKETGMAGRDREFFQAVSGLTDTVSRGQMEFSNSEFNQVLGLQTLLGRSGIAGLSGQQGADVLAQIDSGIKNGGNQVDLMLGWGSKFQGYEGRWELEKLKGDGISNPELLKELFTNLDTLGGKGNTAYQGMWLVENMGLTAQQADALLEMAPKLKEGGLSKAEIEKMMSEGAEISGDRTKDWQDSQAQRRAENDAKKENLGKYMGSPLDKAWESIKEGFFSQPEWMQSAELVGGVGATGFLGSAIGKKLFGGGGAAGGAGGAGSVASRAWGGVKGLGSKAGKLVGPLGTAMSMAWAADMGNSSADWFFGHKEGDYKSGGLFSNPLKGETYTDSRQGALSKAWDWLTPWDTNSEKSKKDKESKAKQAELLNKEDELLNKRKSTTEANHLVLDKEKKNIDEMKTIMGTEKGSSSSTSGGGILSRFFGGFGLGGGLSSFGFPGIAGLAANASYLAASNSSYAPTSTTNSQFLNQNLKQSSGLSASDINNWIAKKAPKNSLLQGKGDVFMRAAQESGLDPRYLVAHAAHETGWGTSNIAKQKSNFYGIGAFDATPFSSAYGYNNTDAGIIEGAKWISKNYANKGQDTLYKMRNNGGKHEYATDPLWDEKIAGIMAGSPSGSGGGAGASNGNTSVLRVEVGGSVNGMTKENNTALQQAISSKIQSSNVQLSYEFRQGIGGNK